MATPVGRNRTSLSGLQAMVISYPRRMYKGSWNARNVQSPNPPPTKTSLRNSWSAAPVDMTLIRDRDGQFVAHRFDLFRADHLRVVGISHQERHVANAVDAAGNSGRQLEQRRQ